MERTQGLEDGQEGEQGEPADEEPDAAVPTKIVSQVRYHKHPCASAGTRQQVLVFSERPAAARCTSTAAAYAHTLHTLPVACSHTLCTDTQEPSAHVTSRMLQSCSQAHFLHCAAAAWRATQARLQEATVPLRARVEVLDFDGRSDARSRVTLIGHIAPRHLILVHGTAQVGCPFSDCRRRRPGT